MKITLLNTNLYLVLFISFVTFSSLAQQNKYSLLKQDVQFIFEELKFMYDYDQALRKYPIEIRNMNFKIIFCIFKVKLMY
jgi:hypothetical protein